MYSKYMTEVYYSISRIKEGTREWFNKELPAHFSANQVT